MQDQLVLSIRLHDEATFSSYLAGDNEEALSSLKRLVSGDYPDYIYLWGLEGVGKSHLLQACCQYATSLNYSAFYLSLANLSELTPFILERLDDFFLICIDNIQTIAGSKEWEEAFFHLFNRVIQQRSKLLVAGNNSIKHLAITLPDLVSRLISGATYFIKPLTDPQKLAALQLRAQSKGLHLSIDAGNFLLNHYPRDMQAIFNCLEILDQASLKAQRRLTVPFVKSVLGPCPLKDDTIA